MSFEHGYNRKINNEQKVKRMTEKRYNSNATISSLKMYIPIDLQVQISLEAADSDNEALQCLQWMFNEDNIVSIAAGDMGLFKNYKLSISDYNVEWTSVNRTELGHIGNGTIRIKAIIEQNKDCSMFTGLELKDESSVIINLKEDDMVCEVPVVEFKVNFE